ncbi:unnamed protein product [Staurois parvus]|uniref:Uncharacterized protein n=1 Tax=Staurois parvus TaxID=386267 RepID=A0ABN9EI84_9NEOB|nr:unnamed protein product [Staurois parvus]
MYIKGKYIQRYIKKNRDAFFSLPACVAACGLQGLHVCRGGLTIWKLGTARGPWVSRGPHEMPLVPFS